MQGLYRNLILFLLLALAIVGFIAYGKTETEVSTVDAVAVAPAASEGRITAHGTGVAVADPDRATIHASIISEGKAPEDAEINNQKKTNTAIFTLKSLSSVHIADKDINTRGYSLEPMYSYPEDKKPQTKGYRMQTSISVKVSNIKQIDGVVRALASAGVGSIEKVDYSVANIQALRDQAMRKACQNAVHRADVMAQTMGLKRGETLTIKDGDISGAAPVPTDRQLKVSEGQPPDTFINPEKIQVTADCEITFMTAPEIYDPWGSSK